MTTWLLSRCYYPPSVCFFECLLGGSDAAWFAAGAEGIVGVVYVGGRDAFLYSRKIRSILPKPFILATAAPFNLTQPNLT